MMRLVQKESYPLRPADSLWVLGNYFFNLCLVRGNNAMTLIEAGVSGVADAVIAQLDRLCMAPDYLTVTHPHADHLTGLEAMRERYPRCPRCGGAGSKGVRQSPQSHGEPGQGRPPNVRQAGKPRSDSRTPPGERILLSGGSHHRFQVFILASGIQRPCRFLQFRDPDFHFL